MDKSFVCPKTEIKCEMPCGKLSYGRCCGNCRLGDYDSRREEVYCGYYKKYFPKSDSCSNWEDGD